MDQNIGYIYIRNHESYDVHDAYKIGRTINIIERDTQYATSEIIRGGFKMVIAVPIKELEVLEQSLHNEFNALNVKYNAGTEFYHKQIINQIESYLISFGVEYTILSEEGINNLVRCTRLKNTTDQCVPYIPRDYQSIIIDKAVTYFQKFDKGILVLMCGVGKTLISLWITQRLITSTILIGVPNILLLKQWETETSVVFQNVPCKIVSSGVNIRDIEEFLQKNGGKCIVITTYSSAYKVYTATQNKRFVFGMKILDEAHHLTTTNMQLVDPNSKKYIKMLNISSSKQLSLTATLKYIESSCTDNIVVSNDNVEHFGEIIDRKCLLWAIKEDIICDYNIQTIITNEQQLEEQCAYFNIIDENHKRLFLSAFASLKSISNGHSHHLLIYSNSKRNSLILTRFIKKLLDDDYFDMPDIYYSKYHSDMKHTEKDDIINRFENSQYGIISCVYCLNEGWNFPLLDGTVFSENMTSDIRIVQSALRASRKYAKNTNKINKIILPILNRTDWLENNENPDLKKVREVIYQMGLEDETITQKIKVFKLDIEKPKHKPIIQTEDEHDNEFEYDKELTRKLMLKTIKRTALDITYEKSKKIIANQDINSKESYYELCERDNRLSKEPEIIFKGQFTNWIDYLNIQRVYYDLDTCKKKVCEYISMYPDIKKYYLDLSIVSNELCKKDVLFPPHGLWVEYYNVKDLRDIISITNKKKNRGAIF
jgi:predicted helicase